MKNNQPIVWIGESGKSEEVLIEKRLVSMVRIVLVIGTVSVLAFKDAKGLYYLHSAQTANLIGKKGSAIESFIVQNALSSLSASGAYKELEALYRNGLSQSAGWDSSIFVEDGNNSPFRVLPLKTVTQFVRHWDKKGDSRASILTDALMTESLQIRCEAAFVGVSPNVADIHEETNRYMERWENSRTGTIQAHPIFANFCKSNGINGAQAHDYLTFVVTGKTAEQARSGCELIAGNPKIGLNYQPSPEELDLIGAVKMKFCTYGKGDWKSRIERAYTDLTK